MAFQLPSWGSATWARPLWVSPGLGAFPILPAPVPVGTAFDPASASSTHVLSNSNRTVTNSSGGSGATSFVRSVKSVTAGKYCASFSIAGTVGSSSIQIGVADTTQATSGVSNGLANLTKAAGALNDNVGNIYGGTSFGIIGAAGVFNTVGDVVTVCIDRTAGKLWMRVNGGQWNASPTANPATAVGGNTLPAGMTGAWHLGVSLWGNGASVTVDPDPSGKPSGFSGWTDGTPIDVLVVAGESNAAGQATTTSVTYRPDPNVLSFDGTAFVQYRPNVFTGWDFGSPTTHWSTELAYAQAYRAANPTKRLAIVKYAASGSYLYNSGSAVVYDWNVSSSTELFANGGGFVRDALAALVTAGYAPTIRLMWWDQGINDAVDETRSLAYSTNLTDLIAGVRNQSGDWKIPAATKIAIGRMPNAWTYASAIRSAQTAVAAADTGGPQWLMDRDDLTFEADATHWNNGSLLTMGQRLWAIDQGTYTEP